MISTSQRPLPDYTTLTTHIHDPGGIRTRKSSMQACTAPHLIPRSHWDRHFAYCIKYMYIQYTLVTSIRHVAAAQFHHHLVHSKLKTIHSEMNHIYVLSVHSAANTNTSVYVDKIRGFPAFCNTTRHSRTPSFVVRGSQHMFMYILP